jgi:RimJ/RimL family protein N-acetyltransferase
VRLRVPTHEDAIVWHRIFDDPDVMEFQGGRAAELSVYEELTARQRRHDAELGFCLWTVLDGSGQVIGFTGAQPWERAWGPAGEIEIGWRLGREHWGKGYVTAAAQQTLERMRAGCATPRPSPPRPRSGRGTATGSTSGALTQRSRLSQNDIRRFRPVRGGSYPSCTAGG